MARIRSIKPQFFHNEQVATLPCHWRLLFVGLWTQADRDGRLEDRPQRLKAALFPYDDLNIDEGLGSLANAGLIVRYDRNGQRLIYIPTWSKHQQPHIRESVSELPPPESSTVLEPDKPPCLGKGADQEQIREGVPGAARARFERFWAAYPRKTGKDAAWKEWLRRAPDDALTDLMIAKVAEQRRLPQWVKDGGEFIPHPRTWLHQGRWQDEATDRSKSTPHRWTRDQCPHRDRCNGENMCLSKMGNPVKYPLGETELVP